MFELFELNDVSSYILFAGLLIKATTLIGLFYFLQYNINNRSKVNPKLSTSEHSTVLQSQRLHNETNSIAIWLALCARRKESPDDSPHFSLLEKGKFLLFQGGQKCQFNQKRLYPLFLKGSYS